MAVATTGTEAIRRARAGARHRAESVRDRGYWGDGLRVLLRAVPGLTKRGLLEQPFRFQMPPSEEFTIGQAASHTDYDTIGGDQLSRPGAVALRTVSFSTLFLDYDVPWAVHHRGSVADPAPPRSPLAVIDDLGDILEARTPFRVQAGQPEAWGHMELDMLATLRSLEATERAGEPDTRYVSLSLVEFRRPDLIRRKKLGRAQYHPRLPLKVTVHTDGRAVSSDGQRIHGENIDLYDLARTYYGSSGKWRHIESASHIDWPPSRPLKDLAAKRHQPLRLTIPKIAHAAGGH
jgi:hypothetical protein